MNILDTLRGKTALITGGGTGIGFGCARKLIEYGTKVTIVGHIVEQLDQAVKKLHEEFPDADVRSKQCDVTVEEDLKAAIAVAVDDDEQLDIAIANAGSGVPGPILALESDAWQYVNNLNIMGTALTIKHAGLAMKKKGGSIITVSSASAVHVEKFMAPYSTSKLAIEMLTRCAAIELAPFKIRVNCISPGYIITESTEMAFSDSLRKQCLDNTPLGRAGVPEDIANGVLYLTSDMSSWVTGVVLPIGGGMQIGQVIDFEDVARLVFDEKTMQACKGPEE